MSEKDYNIPFLEMEFFNLLFQNAQRNEQKPIISTDINVGSLIYLFFIIYLFIHFFIHLFFALFVSSVTFCKRS